MSAAHAMRDPAAPHVNFEFMRGAIADNPRALPSNLDGVLERRGKFLVMEWKHEGERLEPGQKILLQRLAWQPGFTVLLVIGDAATGGVESFARVRRSPRSEDDWTDHKGRGPEDFVAYYKAWYERADRG